MPMPIMCLDARLRQFAEAFRGCFSRPQWKYFVIVLLALMLCEGRCTLAGLRRQVAVEATVCGLSRFLSRAPWSVEAVAGAWRARFEQQMAGWVRAEQARQRRTRPKRRGRYPATVVTGYLIGDDSTQHKPKGKKMRGLGVHYSGEAHKPVTGHSLVQGLYVLGGRQCPLPPQLYRQKAVCAREGAPFRSKIDLMETLIRTFTPVPGTLTHVLLDSWYTAKRIWRAARERGFLITSGLKSNRWLRIEDPAAPKGWRWQRVDAYVARLTPDQYQKVRWPRGEENREVYVHVLSTRVRKLYRCQVVIIRPTLDGPAKDIRSWASSDLDADLPTLVHHIATRWDIEVLFADAKGLLGMDHYQVMSDTAILRFWTLVLTAYLFLDEERAVLRDLRQAHVTLGEAREAVQRRHRRRFIDWMHQQFSQGAVPDELYALLAA